MRKIVLLFAVFLVTFSIETGSSSLNGSQEQTDIMKTLKGMIKKINLFCLTDEGRNYCGEHGFCNQEGDKDSPCQCNSGWMGTKCEIKKKCPNNCSGNGICISERCICDSLYKGEDCSEYKCVRNCNGNGVCDTTWNTCSCDEGWEGIDCSKIDNNCGDIYCPVSFGKCKKGECKCKGGMTYKDNKCVFLKHEKKTDCPKDCSERGKCISGGWCLCTWPYRGYDCTEEF